MEVHFLRDRLLCHGHQNLQQPVHVTVPVLISLDNYIFLRVEGNLAGDGGKWQAED